MRDLAQRTGNAAKPFLMFTHIPDVQDPYRREEKDGDKVVCTYGSSWFLSKDAGASWNGVLSNPNFTGLFAGHFHAVDMDRYGGPFNPASAAAGTNARKVFIAPPLSMKNQWTVHDPRRGWMLMTISGAGTQADVRWYKDIDPLQSATASASKVSPALLLTCPNLRRFVAGLGMPVP